jgi:PAS domain S-box-containing protein
MNKNTQVKATTVRDSQKKRGPSAPSFKWHDSYYSQMLLDIAGTIILVLDARGRVTLVNRKGCEVLRCRREEILGKNWFKTFLPKENKKLVKNVFDQVMKGDLSTAAYYENPVLTKTGERRIIGWHNTCIRDSDGRIIGTLSSASDITEKKLVDEEREQLVKELKSALKKAVMLKGIIPICGYCKKIRDKDGMWHQVEVFVRDHSNAEFTHTLCPKCADEWIEGRTQKRG